jgi:hypothetical protein
MTIQYHIVRPDGEVRCLEDTATIARDADGRLVKFNGVASDITERNRLIAATEYRGNLLRAVSIAAAELLTAVSIEEVMAYVLKTVGEATRVQRMFVFENRCLPAEPPLLNCDTAGFRRMHLRSSMVPSSQWRPKFS